MVSKWSWCFVIYLVTSLGCLYLWKDPAVTPGGNALINSVLQEAFNDKTSRRRVLEGKILGNEVEGETEVRATLSNETVHSNSIEISIVGPNDAITIISDIGTRIDRRHRQSHFLLKSGTWYYHRERVTNL